MFIRKSKRILSSKIVPLGVLLCKKKVRNGAAFKKMVLKIDHEEGNQRPYLDLTLQCPHIACYPKPFSRFPYCLGSPAEERAATRQMSSILKRIYADSLKKTNEKNCPREKKNCPGCEIGDPSQDHQCLTTSPPLFITDHYHEAWANLREIRVIKQFIEQLHAEHRNHWLLDHLVDWPVLTDPFSVLGINIATRNANNNNNILFIL